MPTRNSQPVPARSRETGYSLVEVLVVLSFLSISFAVGGTALSRGLTTVEARGAAQTWQAAGAWGQVAAVWQGTSTDVAFASGHVSVAAGAAGGGDLGAIAPSVPALTNITRWQQGQGVSVRFLAGSGNPNSAGSLYFQAPGSNYRVTVRLESGLTVRTWVGATP